MNERSHFRLLYLLAVIGLVLDQVSKYVVFLWLGAMPGATTIQTTVGKVDTFPIFQATTDQGFQLVASFDRLKDGTLVPHVNQGALFGFMGQNEGYANGTFAIISCVAALAIVGWSLFQGTCRDRWLCAALGLILGGTIGNLYDRLLFNGVRDFLHWNYLFDWPVFNIADVCLVVGAGLLLIQAFLAQPAADGSASVASKSVSVPTAPQV